MTTPIHRSITLRRVVLLLGAALMLGAPAAASASTTQLSVLEDSNRLLSGDPSAQQAAADEIKALGAEIVKIHVQWRSIAPDGLSAAKPSVDLTNPVNYPGWAIVDNAVALAQARGLRVWLMVDGPAPRWAVPKELPSVGVGAYQPDPAAYAQFVTAVAKHFASVDIWSIWNEPNIGQFIQPQSKGSVVVSAIWYRKLYRAAYAALRANGHAGATILFGELMPRAKKTASPYKNTPPIMWLRDFFCIDASGKKLTGRAAKQRECAGFQPIKASGIAYHPYTPPSGPFTTDTGIYQDSATITHLSRVTKVLDQASKARRLGGRKLKIWSSEFGFQSDPPDLNFIQIRKIPYYLNASEYLSYANRRVATYSQYLIVDDSELGAFQSGLRFVDGTAKPGVYEAYQLPIVVTKLNSSTVNVWGCLRSTAGGSSVDVQIDNGGTWTTVRTVSVTNDAGYFQQKISMPGAAGKTFRLSANGVTSRQTRPAAQLKAYTN